MKTALLILSVIIITIWAVAQERPIYEIHAAMTYNFIKYTQWPDENESGDFVVGIMGDENLSKVLKQVYEGKPKGNKKILVKNLSSPEEAPGCHVVYISKSKSKEFEVTKNSTKGKSILIITDSNGLGEKGSSINFKVVEGRLRFELNQSTMAARNLKVAGQLSSMALIIE